jgi:hypothetical protein
MKGNRDQNAFSPPILIIQASIEVQFQIMLDLGLCQTPVAFVTEFMAPADISFVHASDPVDLGASCGLRTRAEACYAWLGLWGWMPLTRRVFVSHVRHGSNSLSHTCSLQSAILIRVPLVAFIFFV